MSKNMHDKKIAFCFLLYDTVKHAKLWENFFTQDDDSTHSIYSHVKQVTDKTPSWIEDNKIRTIKTEWCNENLVNAWINMLKAAYKDKNNKYFVLLSGDCIPLFEYWTTYKKITSSSKSRMNLDYNTGSYEETGLVYADQWVVLNRKCAKLLIDLRETDKGKAYKKYMKSVIDVYCPDEIYPINWFIHNFGKPSSQEFKKNIRKIVTTYTKWSDDKTSPDVLSASDVRNLKSKICESKAIFGRKFEGDAAKAIGMSC